MGNCARRLGVWAPELTTMSSADTSATPVKTSNFHSALGDRSSAGLPMEQKCEFSSARVEEMMQSSSQFSSAVEHEIEHSNVHWSEGPGLSELSEDNDQEEEVNRENREVFAELRNDPQWEHHEWGPFFGGWPRGLKLGRKIAEGGQAAIFEIIEDDGNVVSGHLLKVFKRGARLSDLKKQWPCGILRQEVGTCMTYKGVMFEDGRFAFLMTRCWGDLRKLIDQAMQEKNNQGPPFPYEWNEGILHAKSIMQIIAIHMVILDKHNIIHRDLKATNILLYMNDKSVIPFVKDFECSIGVVGTGFWRALEILLALKNRSTFHFTKKMDVYSFGMLCFEVVTGCLPFQDELDDCRASRDLIIVGQRPKLSSDLNMPLKDLIESCWNPIPNERPTFEETLQVLRTL